MMAVFCFVWNSGIICGPFLTFGVSVIKPAAQSCTRASFQTMQDHHNLRANSPIPFFSSGGGCGGGGRTPCVHEKQKERKRSFLIVVDLLI
jgi:hypothetical protein